MVAEIINTTANVKRITAIIADALVPKVTNLISYRLIIAAVIIGGNYCIKNSKVHPQKSFYMRKFSTF
jgi:hypothetical protein